MQKIIANLIEMEDLFAGAAGTAELASGQQGFLCFIPFDAMRKVDVKSGVKAPGTDQEYAWSIPAHAESSVFDKTIGKDALGQPIAKYTGKKILGGKYKLELKLEYYADGDKATQPKTKVLW